jgi:hypothetical protein
MAPRASGRLALLIAATLLAGLIVSAARPTTARADNSCPSMQIIGVRGSGQTADDAEGFGSTVKAVVDAVRGGNPTAAAMPVDYPAVAVRWWDPNYYRGNYTESVREGTTRLKRHILDFIGSGCGATTFLYLVGYSQGAQVVGDAYQGLAADEQQRVAGVALIADPKFNGLEGAPVDVGTYKAWRFGVQGVLLPTLIRRLPRSHESRVRSYCIASDPVCNFTISDAANCINKPGCPHVHYMDRSYPKSGLPYTTEAARFLLARWRSPG